MYLSSYYYNTIFTAIFFSLYVSLYFFLFFPLFPPFFLGEYLFDPQEGRDSDGTTVMYEREEDLLALQQELLGVMPLHLGNIYVHIIYTHTHTHTHTSTHKHTSTHAHILLMHEVSQGTTT